MPQTSSIYGSPESLEDFSVVQNVTTSGAFDLQKQLDGAFCKSKYDTDDLFLPNDIVEQLVNEQSVEHYCSVHAATHLKRHTKKVLEYVFGDHSSNSVDSARHVFAALVLLDEPSLIPGIVNHRDRIRDCDLPLVQCNKQGSNYQFALGSRNQIGVQPLDCFRTWTKMQKDCFDKCQFLVKAPFFSRLRQHQVISPPEYIAMDLDKRSVLPFTSYGNPIASGNSRVHRVVIHPAHHEVDIDRPEAFALKTIDVRDGSSISDFRLEVKALMKIRDQKKAHLVDVVTTFKYRNSYHLLNRWASGGNLADLWASKVEPMSRDAVCWFAQQCWGLADALDGIHDAKLSTGEVAAIVSHSSSQYLSPSSVEYDNKFCGRHGDIKPKNILWFAQDNLDTTYGRGMLKISDFGLTTFHTASTTKDAPTTKVTWTYAPPEWSLQESISRPFDIWSLGCVYLEFITWAAQGKQGVEKFAQERMKPMHKRDRFVSDDFYILDDNCGKVKESVKAWVNLLKQRLEGSPYMLELIEYIEGNMLVVDKSKRDKSSVVTKRLANMYQKCLESKKYAF